MLPELCPEILLASYAQGMFPMGDEKERIMWFSPDPRGIIPLDEFHVSRNLRRLCESDRFTVTVNKAFDQVMANCADRGEETWITADINTFELGLRLPVLALADEELQGAALNLVSCLQAQIGQAVILDYYSAWTE